MSYRLKVQCPDCGGKFSVELEANDPMPDFCHHCGTYVGGDPNFVPSQLNMSTPLGRSGDQTYRMLEASSAARAESTGDASLKVTDLNDNLREGDVAAKPVKNMVSQYAEAAKDAFGFDYFQANTATYVADAKTDPRHTGAGALSAIQEARGGPPAPARLGGKWGGG